MIRFRPGLYQSDLYSNRRFFLTWEGIAVIAVTAITAAVSAYSAKTSGDNAKEAADYTAKVTENNALDAQQRGSIAAAEYEDKVRRMIGTQNVTAAANGLMTNTGTPLDIMTDTAGMGKLDSLRLLNNAGRQAQGFNEQSTLDTFQGNNAQTAGTLNAAGAVLGAASSGVKSYYGAKQMEAYNAQQ